MKTLFSLTSRGRVRVFFDGLNNPGGAGGGNNAEEGTSSGRVRNALTALVFAMSGTDAAYAQAPEPTQVAATTAAGKCDAILDTLEQAICLRKEAKELATKRTEIEKARHILEKIALLQREREESLDQAALNTLREAWSRIVAMLESMNNGKALSDKAPVSTNILAIFGSGEYDSILDRVVKLQFPKWESAEAILQARGRK